MTLKDFFEKYKQVKIPLLQRDFVQSNHDKFGDFLTKIKNALEGDEKLHLGLIYGKVDEQKNFYPIDGQQRLSTLCLVYDESKLCYENDMKLSDENEIEFLKEPNLENHLENEEIAKGIHPHTKAINNAKKLIKDHKIHKINSKNLSNITLDLIILEDFGLSDELYIKLNARGKALSEFDKIKPTISKHFSDDFKKLIDSDLCDLFFDFCKNDVEVIDDMLYNLFYNFTFIDDKGFASYDDEDFANFVQNAISFIYKQHITKDFHPYKKYFLQDFKDFIKDSHNNKQKWVFISYFLYAFDDFYDNARIIHNIFYNAYILEYANIKELFKSIYTDFSYKNSLCIDDFSKLKDNLSKFNQLEEESKKQELIKQNLKWLETFIKAERHFYLKGQIAWLYELAKCDLAWFEFYFARFDDRFKSSDEHLFERALLTKGFYFVSWEELWEDKYDGFYCACGFDTKLFRKEQGFRLVFKKAKYIKALLDDDRNLQTIIDDYKNTKCWKYYLIKQARMFKGSAEYGLTIVKKDEKIAILNKEYYSLGFEYYINALNLELYDSDYFLAFTSNFKQEDLESIDSENHEFEIGSKKISISYNYEDNRFYVDGKKSKFDKTQIKELAKHLKLERIK